MRFTHLVPVPTILAACVAACGSSSTGPGGGGPTPTGPAVSIQNFAFAPSMVTVKVGQTVTWTNTGPSTHTATSDSLVWDSGNLSPPSGGGGYGGGSPGGTFAFTFTKAGTYTYHCTIHPPSMYPSFTGTVTVTP